MKANEIICRNINEIINKYKIEDEPQIKSQDEDVIDNYNFY